MKDETPNNRLAVRYQCFVCGAIFTTEQDRHQHLEKERHGTTENNDSETVDL
jgi:ribosomal protein L44E